MKFINTKSVNQRVTEICSENMLLGAGAKRNGNTDCEYMEISEILTNSTQKVNAIADKRKNNFILQGHATLVYRERRNA